MSLDLMVARALHAARLFERAVNDPGPWTVSYDGFDMPATRVLRESSVEFWAFLPDACWLSDEGPLVLSCRDDEIAVKPFEPPARGGGRVVWSVSLPTLVTQ